MAIPWLVVLKSVPWAEVISNAPKVADGAKKLWNTIGKKSPDESMRSAGNAESRPKSLQELQDEIETLQTGMSELHGQLLASSELIKTLAEQNGQLIRRIEANRIRTLWLATALTLIGAIAVYALLNASPF